MLGGMVRVIVLMTAFVLVGCNPSLYVTDGVTDGDTFNLAPRALVDDDPVLQSWVAYSLTRSACQLGLTLDNPARASSYGCEFSARRILLDTWEEQKAEHPQAQDAYLDSLLAVQEAGFLDEYTVDFFAESHWQIPAEVDVRAFRQWRRRHLRGHEPETRWVGSWGYRRE
ncbi:MAG: hypothetical protein R3315_07150 [Woeseiaceae bacterium]|nr:hypothetical protein [Woeseiaceae bacterium]